MIKNFVYLTLTVVCLVGCNSNSSYTPSRSISGATGGGSFYDSNEYKSADPKVQEDVLIYDILRSAGYSESESRDAVINSMDQ